MFHVGAPFPFSIFHFWFGDTRVILQPGAIQGGLAGCPLSLRCGVLSLPTGVTRMVPSSFSVEDAQKIVQKMYVEDTGWVIN